eukprot:COSAG02_NODE_9675_length_2146_cov_2.826575_2_plen_223_part_00
MRDMPVARGTKRSHDRLTRRILDSHHVKIAPPQIGDKCAGLPPVQKVLKKENSFTQGDKVKIRAEKADRLDAGRLAMACGNPSDWALKPGSVGMVMAGRRWNGDCLVEMDGQRLWLKSPELELVKKSGQPRPNSSEALKAPNMRNVTKPKQWVTSKRLAQARWNAQMGEVVPEAEVQMELALKLPTDLVELEELQTKLRIGIVAALGVDASQIGEIELSAPN